VQNLEDRRRSGNVREGAKIISGDNPALFALAPAQFVNAMPTCHLTHPRAKGIFLILFLEDRVKFQEDFRRGILSVFRVPKEPTADLQDVGIVSRMNGAQNLAVDAWSQSARIHCCRNGFFLQAFEVSQSMINHGLERRLKQSMCVSHGSNRTGTMCRVLSGYCHQIRSVAGELLFR
jgi:hypothetical protein